MGNRPRWIREDAAYCEVQRTVDRQFFFKPDPLVRNIIGAAAGRMQKKFPVKIYWLLFNINHKQDGIAPLSGDPKHLQNVVSFNQQLNSIIAREINRHIGRDGGVFSSRNRSEEAVDDLSLEQQMLYAITNPVKDGLVDRVAHWKGFSSYDQMASGNIEQFTYIDHTAWHHAGGERSRKPREAFTNTAYVEYSPLPSWQHLNPSERQALLRRRVRQLEQDFRATRAREGRTVVGPNKLEKLDHRDRPKTPAKKSPQPLCHASTVEAANEYKEAFRGFLEQYKYASGMWMAGNRDVEFPRGSFRPPLISPAV